MSDSTFTLNGRVGHVERKATKSGKTFAVATIEFDVLSKFPQVVQVKLFGRNEDAVNVGDLVEIKGVLSGRMWNDKVFNDLVVREVTMVSAGARSVAALSESKEASDEVPF